MHIPSSMNNILGASTSILIIAVAPDLNAGGSIIQTITDSNRDRLNSIGSKVNSVNFNVTTRENTASGIIEYAIWKLERQTDVPQVVVSPMPTNVDIEATGLQQAMRLNMPGRIIMFGTFAYTPEVAMSRVLIGKFAKFKLSSVRPGDYFGILLYNRSSGAQPVTIDIQMRYKELKS